jgi:hypothetical protein
MVIGGPATGRKRNARLSCRRPAGRASTPCIAPVRAQYARTCCRLALEIEFLYLYLTSTTRPPGCTGRAVGIQFHWRRARCKRAVCPQSFVTNAVLGLCYKSVLARRAHGGKNSGSERGTAVVADASPKGRVATAGQQTERSAPYQRGVASVLVPAPVQGSPVGRGRCSWAVAVAEVSAVIGSTGTARAGHAITARYSAAAASADAVMMRTTAALCGGLWKGASRGNRGVHHECSERDRDESFDHGTPPRAKRELFR